MEKGECPLWLALPAAAAGTVIRSCVASDRAICIGCSESNRRLTAPGRQHEQQQGLPPQALAACHPVPEWWGWSTRGTSSSCIIRSAVPYYCLTLIIIGRCFDRVKLPIPAVSLGSHGSFVTHCRARSREQ